MIWSIDGTAWDVPCQIERTAEMTASDISGVLLDKTYFNDVLGTYMKYTVAVAVPFGMEAAINEIYEIVTTPVDGHEFVLPYNGSTITVVGHVKQVSDRYVYMGPNKNYWRGFKFEVVSNHPSKEMSLGEVVTRGMTRVPSRDEGGYPFIDGAYYQWIAAESAFERVVFREVDEVSY